MSPPKPGLERFQAIHRNAAKKQTVQNVPDSFINWFRFSAPYIRKHREATFVIALPGEAVAHPNFMNLVHDLAMLQSLGARLIIVQGARQQINQALSEAAIEAPLAAGVRVSSAEAMPHIIAASNRVRTELESAMSAGLVDSPMYQLNLKTLSGNFLSAKPLGIREGVDYQYTGLVRQVDAKAINSALNTGAAVIANTLGYSSTGETFNLSLNNCTLEIAKSVGADKLIGFCSNEQLQPMLDSTEIKPTRAHEVASAAYDERSLVDAMADGVEQGIDRAHIVSYEDNGALLKELFTHDGSGLLISKKELAHVRAAEPSDVGSILELIQPLQESGALVQRTRDLLEAQIQSFAVLDIDGTAVGCASLQNLDETSGEIACVAVHKEFQGRGYASQLMNYLETRAQQTGLKQLFLFSTQASHWFMERGYNECSTDQLPSQRRELYDSSRNSRVLLKEL